MKRRLASCFQPATGLFLCLLLGLLAAGRERMLRDPGTFWHTVVGERIITSGQLPREDAFSFTAAGQKWLAQQWLAELAMALVHRLAGLDGLLLISCAILSGVFAWLAARLRSGGLKWPTVLLLVLLGLGAASCHFMPRPHLASIVLIGACHAILCDVEVGRREPRSLLWLPVILVVWTNLHGGALGGLATIVICLIGWLWTTNFSRVLIGAVASLCIVAILVNPYGSALPAVWIGLMGSDVLPRLIVEHAPLQLASPEGVMILTLGAVYIGALIRVRRAGWRVTWLLPLVWLALALSRVRHGPLFAVTALVAIGELIHDVSRIGSGGPGSRLRRLLDAGDCAAGMLVMGPATVINGPDLACKSGAGGGRGAVAISKCALAVPVAFVVLALALQHAGLRVPVIGAGWARASETYWPSATLTALRDRLGDAPSNPRVFNDLLFGGYLIFGAPRARVFIDDRCELHGDQALIRYAELCRSPNLIGGVCDYEDVWLALVSSGSSFDRYFAAAPNWRPICRDPASVLYARRILR